MTGHFLEKVCPVVVRGGTGKRDIVVYRHPQAGVQLVKGTLEPGEPVLDGALRELVKESGVVGRPAAVLLCSSLAVVPGQLWHFVLVEAENLPERWVFDTYDDGGHQFAFFWWKSRVEPDREWHPDFVRVLRVIRQFV